MSQIAHLAILSTSLYFCTRDPSQLKRPSMQRDIIQYIDTVLITLQNRDSSILTEQTILCKTESEFFLQMLRFTACLKSGSDSSCPARKKQVLISNETCETGTPHKATDRGIEDAACVRSTNGLWPEVGRAVKSNRIHACLKSGSDSSCPARKKQVLISNETCETGNRQKDVCISAYIC